ncbi:MAG: hypothetical protein WB392_06635 [Methanotrichaceae archaeon]
MFLATISIGAAISDAHNVGGNFGKLWLEQHGAPPSSNGSKNSLWDWGSAPHGYETVDGKLYPSGYMDQWYYPDFMTNSTPILVNITAPNSGNYSSSDSTSSDAINEDPWVLAQTTGRPVRVFSLPQGTLK